MRVWTVIVVMLIAGASLAVTGGPASGDPSPAIPRGETGPPPTGERSQTVVLPQAGRDAAIEARRRREEQLANQRRDPAEQRRRQESRARYRDQSPAEAVQTARSTHRPVVEAPVWRGVGLRAGERLTGFRGPHAATVVREGRTATVESSLPLQLPDRSGSPQPASLTLVDAGGHFELANPLVETRFGKRAADGVSLPSIGLTVRPEGAGGAEARVVEGKLFYANAARDTDHVVMPLPAGIETFTQLRSADSPERLVLAFDLPADARLVVAERGGWDILRGTELLGTVSPVTAVDVDGTPVPVKAVVEGSRMVIDVAHRAADLHYPIMVDPAITEDFRYWRDCPSCTMDVNGWRQYRNGPVDNWTFYWGDGYLGRGLWMYHRGARWIGGGEYAQWLFDTPPEARIVRSEFGYVKHEPYYTCVFNGIFSWSSGTWQGGWGEPWQAPVNGSPLVNCGGAYSGGLHYHYSVHCRQSDCAWTGNLNNASVFGLQADGSSRTRYDFTGHMGQQATWIEDYIAPGHSEDVQVARNWTNANPSFKIRSTDRGLGVQRLIVDAPDHPGWNGGYDHNPGCSGNRFSRCYEWLAVTGYLNNMPEGIWAVRARSHDAVGQWSETRYDARRDWTAPNIALSGSLYDRRGTALSAGSYTLRVTATDGVHGGARADQRSGVRSVDIRVNGVSQGVQTQSCGDSCPLTRDFTWSTASWPDSTNRTIEVVATDALGHVRTTSFSFSQDTVQPGMTPSGTVNDNHGKTVYGPSYTFNISASDPSPSSGITQTEFFVDGVSRQRTTQSPSSTMYASFTFNTDSYTDATHTVRAAVTDRAGNVRYLDRVLTVDRRGDIYTAQIVTGNPAAGGRVEATEHVRAGLSVARREERDAITTRSTAICSGPSGDASCDEVRSRTRMRELDPAAPESYVSFIGDGTTDPRLSGVAEILAPASSSAVPASTGSLTSILQSWQTPPPVHGATFQLFDTTEQVDGQHTDGPTSVRTQLWIDEATKFPIRRTVTVGTEVTTVYFHYQASRRTTSEVAADFFNLAPPSTPAMSKQLQFKGAAAVGQTRDAQTGTLFQPYFLGTSPVASAGPLCYATSDVIRQTATAGDALTTELAAEGQAADAHAGNVTTVNAMYNVVDEVSDCIPGKGTLENPAYELATTAKNSTMAQIWRKAYKDAALQFQTSPGSDETGRGGVVNVVFDGVATQAYLIPLDAQRTGALMEKDNTTLIVHGIFDKTSIVSLAATMQKL